MKNGPTIIIYIIYIIYISMGSEIIITDASSKNVYTNVL